MCFLCFLLCVRSISSYGIELCLLALRSWTGFLRPDRFSGTGPVLRGGPDRTGFFKNRIPGSQPAREFQELGILDPGLEHLWIPDRTGPVLEVHVSCWDRTGPVFGTVFFGGDRTGSDRTGTSLEQYSVYIFGVDYTFGLSTFSV